MGYLRILAVFFLFTVSLNAEVKVLAFSGSTRYGSYNTLLVQEAAKIAQSNGAKVTLIDLDHFPMPFFNEDLEKRGMPEFAKQFRRALIEHQAIIISSPEYNSSIPALLKNALDWASRSEDGKPSREAFQGKQFAILSASLGPGGGKRGLEHLRQILQNAGGEVVQKQVSIANAHQAFDENGRLKDSKQTKELEFEIQQLLLKFEIPSNVYRNEFKTWEFDKEAPGI